MNLFAAMRVFRSIVECGSFTAAAERLDTTHSSVSRQLRQLETHLGARLLDRNSRQLTPTEAGRDYLRASIDILDRVHAAGHAVGGEQQPHGELRVSAPLVIGTLELPQWLPAFLERHPRIELNLSCDDRLVDLIGGGFDMALRIAGPLADSSLVARELARTEMILVAAPSYVLRRGLPRKPADLAQHLLLGVAGTRAGTRPLLQGPRGEAVPLRPNARFRTDAITALHAATLAAQGIAAFTRLTVQGDLAAGRLVRVLPGHRVGQRHYYAVYPHARQLAPKVRALSDFMREHYAALAPPPAGKA